LSESFFDGGADLFRVGIAFNEVVFDSHHVKDRLNDFDSILF
jgi:hypothetical protein